MSDPLATHGTDHGVDQHDPSRTLDARPDPWRYGARAAAATALLVVVALAVTAVLRPSPGAAADDVRDAAARATTVLTDPSQDPATVTSPALTRRLDAGGEDARAPLDAIAGYTPEEPVVLALDDREARVVVVLRDQDRRRLELVLIEHDGWVVDRFEVY